MVAKDLGTKFICFKCGTKFYDLRKPEPLCPKCGADQRERPADKPERKRASRAAAVEEPVLEEEVIEDEEALPEDDEADELPESDEEDL